MTKWDVGDPGEEYKAQRAQISALYDAADWRGCYLKAKELASAYPRSVDAQISRAALLGDSAETFTGSERRKRKQAAVRELRYWAKTPPIRLPPATAGHAWNELFYHSADFKRQALLGRADLASGLRGLYSLGVGAAFYSAELMRSGQRVRAQRWATEAVETWQSFFSKPQPRDRWDTHCFLAVALAVLGKFADAEAELEKVKGIIGRDIRETNIYDIEERLAWCRRGI